MNLKLWRLQLFYGLVVFCIIATIRCQSSAKVQHTETEKTCLATRVDHFYVESDQARLLFTFFKDTLHLPESWPFRDAGTHTSGGLWLGNTVIEFVKFPHNSDTATRTGFRGIAFESAEGADETASALTKRNISHYEVENFMGKGADGQMRVNRSLLDLKDFPPAESDIFFVDYKFRKAVAARHEAINDELESDKGGPLGIIEVAEIIVGVRDIKEARRKWCALLSPSPLISNDAFFFDTGPAIRLVQTKSPGIKGIILRVNSLDYAVKFLDEHGWLSKNKNGEITLSPDIIEGLSIKLVEALLGDMQNNPLLGSGRGVDHLGLGVRDIKETCRDYEQTLGFKCIKNPTGNYSGSLRSLIIFKDEILLELLSPPKTDSVMNSEYLSYMRDFLSKHEGAMSLALETSSSKDAAEYLRGKDFEWKIRSN